MEAHKFTILTLNCGALFSAEEKWMEQFEKFRSLLLIVYIFKMQ